MFNVLEHLPYTFFSLDMEIDDAVSEPCPSKFEKKRRKSQPKKVKSSLCDDSSDSTMNASDSIPQSEMKVAQDLKAEREANNAELKYTKKRKRRHCRDNKKNYSYDEDLNEELESTSVDEENHLRVKIFKRKRVVQEPDTEYALPAEKKLSYNKHKNKEVGNEDLEVEVKVEEEKYWQSREIERLKKHLIEQGLGNKIPTTVMSRKLLLAKLRYEVRTVNHVSVVLAEHTDKFEIKTFTSTEQKHRRMSMEEKSHSSYVCKICGVFQAGVEEKMRMHIEQHLNGKFMCKLCNLDFSSIREKRQHSKQFHPYRGRASNAKVCQCCGQEFWHTTDWKEHAFKCYGEASFTCSFCDEKFPLRKDLLAHLENSHLEHAFTCEKCNRHYFEEKLWANHTVNCDGEIPASSSKTCHLCGKVLSTLITLRSHISGVHNKEKKFQCTLCPYSCLRSKEFKHHMDVHEGTIYTVGLDKQKIQHKIVNIF